MHLPDGFLDAKTSLLTGALSLTCLSVALREVSSSQGLRSAPLLGVTSAFVFAAQMVNFPIAGGTSGHLLGGVFCAVLLGPAAAVVVMTCVLLVQCLMFADGGLSALGANLLNMGVVDVLAGWLVYEGLRRVVPLEPLRARVTSAAFGAWCGTVAASIACAGELAVSGVVPWRLGLPAMAGVHMVIGLGEALITGLALGALASLRPELLRDSVRPRGPAIALLAAAALAAVLAAPFASTMPDGLEAIAARLGFAARESAPAVLSPFPEYSIAGLSPAAATLAAGAIGSAVAFAASFLVARAVVRARPVSAPHDPPRS